jgi:hypothetical protein
MKPSLCLFAASALLPLSLAAQTTSTKVIPNPGTGDGSSSTPFFSGYGSGIAQQITLGSTLCNSSSILFELALRADGSSMAAVPARSFKTLTLSLGYTSNGPGGMSNTFATNRTGAQTQVFSGAYSLPAQNSTTRPFNVRWKLTKPFIYLRNSGNLLIEYTVPQPYSKSQYFLDTHHQPGGAGISYNYGKAGAFSSPESPRFTCFNNSELKPGGKAEFIVQPLSKQYPALSIWGFSKDKWGAINLPLDLAGLGATQNYLHVRPDLMLALPLTPLKIGFEGRMALPIPVGNQFMGLNVFTQLVFLDQKANNAGLVFSEGLSMTVQQTQAVARLLGTHDHKLATGSLSPAGTGLVIEFRGSFN